MPLRGIKGKPSPATICQLVKSTSVAVGLYNSIHSSKLEARVPPQATSLITTCGATGVLVIVGVLVAVKVTGVNVGVGVGERVGVPVLVGVLVLVDVFVGDDVGVGTPQVVTGLDKFWGSLGARKKKSVELLFPSMQMPMLSAMRSYPRSASVDKAVRGVVSV